MKSTRVTPNEAAKLLGVSADRVRAWCESGVLPSYRSVNAWRKIDRHDSSLSPERIRRSSLHQKSADR